MHHSESVTDMKLRLLKESIRAFLFHGMSEKEAREVSQNLINAAERASNETGSCEYPPFHGNIILTDQKWSGYRTHMKRQGVTDDDIRWWWDLHDIERCYLIEQDNMWRVLFATDKVENGMSMDQAAALVRKHFPIFFGAAQQSPNDPNRALPFELKLRIDEYAIRRQADDPVQFSEDIQRSSSMNALIRDEIKRGRL